MFYLGHIDQIVYMAAHCRETCQVKIAAILLIGSCRRTDRMTNLCYNCTYTNTEKPEIPTNAYNGYIITWILHQIFLYPDKVMLAAG